MMRRCVTGLNPKTCACDVCRPRYLPPSIPSGSRPNKTGVAHQDDLARRITAAGISEDELRGIFYKNSNENALIILVNRFIAYGIDPPHNELELRDLLYNRWGWPKKAEHNRPQRYAERRTVNAPSGSQRQKFTREAS